MTTDLDDAAALAVVLGDDAIPTTPLTAADAERAPVVVIDRLSIGEVFRTGGVSLIAVLFALNLVDEFVGAALAVLAPDIQRSLGVSDTVIGVTGALTGGFILLGSLPIAYLSDRMRRVTVIGVTSLFLGAFAAATALAQTAWHLAIARIGAGIGKGNHPAYQSLLADAFPVAGRARAFAVFNLANPIAQLMGPALAGATAGVIGGPEAWRWTFVVLAIPIVILGAVARRLPEPARGANERRAVLGSDDPPLTPGVTDTVPSLAVAFARLRNIRSFYYFLVGLAAVGYALFSFPLFFNLFLEERFGLDALDRGFVLSLVAIGSVIGVPLGGYLGDRYFRESPPRAILAGAVCMLAFLANVLALFMPHLWLLIPVSAFAHLGTAAAFTTFTATIAAVIPYRLRAQGFAMIGLYVFVFGALFGAFLTGMLSDAHGVRTALTIVVPPPVIVGSAIMALGARHIRRDIALVVEDITEERAEAERLAAGGRVPALQVRNVDFSYGQLQVLFDVDLDVYPGEVLALLGTNGAGKSTLLKVISGLEHPSRGVVRFNGRGITYADAESRVRQGIVQVPGGHAVFAPLTVGENLLIGGYTFVWDRARLQARADAVLELFPRLAERIDQPAGSLSGGEQQMLAIAKAMLLEPEVLCIDELSMGLAPVIVQELLGVVEQLKAAGTTLVLVEQSVNVALSIADRAVFMEKGRVRFEGAAEDLRQRDDLVRAVFLGEGSAPS